VTAPAATPAGKAGDVADGLVDVDPYDDGIPGGIPLYDWNTAPKAELATRRQLRAMGLRPGGHGPAAELKCRNCSFKPRTECRHKALLFRIDIAKKVRPMTLAKEVALDKAMAARQTCPRCGRRYYYCLPLKTLGMCVPCHDGVPADPTHYTLPRTGHHLAA
jgi:ribosomal protein S26